MPRKNAAEWAVFSVSLLIVAGLLVYLGAQSFAAANEPVRVVAEAGPAEPRDGRLVVPVAVTNEGDRPAADIVVSVELPGAEEAVELTFARLARHERAEGEAVFDGPAAGPGPATARVLGYTTP